MRKEKDMLGEREIPQDVYWGINTLRAIENFNISNKKVNLSLIKSLALVKQACAQTNRELSYIAEEKANAIETACQEIINGKFDDQFPIDALQGGAGTSTNMNINEVLANRSIELLGGKKSDYSLVHPIDDVNLHQSTNDTYPTALKIAIIKKLKSLSSKIENLQNSFQTKEKTFADIIKIGRTELQEAVPMTLGLEFSAFSEAISRDRWRTFKCEERIRVINLGGTAIGTGLTAPKKYIFLVTDKLRELTGLGLARAENLVDQTANSDSFVEISGILKAHATNLIKICTDLKLLSFLGEITLPKLQTGSSIMPGKTNPVLLEATIQAGIKIIANDQIITDTVSRGTLQINEYLPLLADAILESLDLLININDKLSNFILELSANPKKCLEYVERSPETITTFVSHLGYEKTEALINEYHSSDKNNVRQFLIEKFGEDLVTELLSAANITALGHRNG